MAAKTQAKNSTENEIIALFMNYVLENEVVPKSIYKFCKINKIKEENFYKHFGSVEGIQKAIWISFYKNTEILIRKNTEFESFSNKDKMLTFFFSFFELLNLNRSYVIFSQKNTCSLNENMLQLKGLRKCIKAFANNLIREGNANKSLKITQHSPSLFSEGAWVQFLFLLKFWMNDDSAGFEKTDIAIEKSVNTVFDIFDNTPFDSIIDFGKFIFKEKLV